MAEQKNYYAIIPANVRYDPNLKDKAKLLYGEITALCNEKGYCWATNDYFANLYGVSKTTISLLIKNLIESGYINSQIIYKEGTKEILNRYLSIVKDPIKENLNTPIKENLKDNNTSFNNTSNNTYEIYSPAKAEQRISYKEIIEYLNNRTGASYRHTTNKTKDLIKARFNEGFTLEDFKEVIDKKCIEWYGTDMQKYLRPETLFGTKFESYLNQQMKERKLTTKDIQDKIDFSDF
jgi:uncharacterized phage protein (TIGR02220 family)